MSVAPSPPHQGAPASSKPTALGADSVEKNCDFLLLTSTDHFDQRLDDLSKSLGYQSVKRSSAEQAVESFEGVSVPMVVMDACAAQDQNEVVGEIQLLRYGFPKAQIGVVFPKRFDPAVLSWIRKSGANLILSESDFLQQSRIDFFSSQWVGTEYVPVKHGDFQLGSKIDCSLFYFMSANRKYFPLVGAQTILDERRLEKIKKVGDVYIRRSDFETYQQYLVTHQDLSAKGLIRRCRVEFSQFREAFLQLVNHLTEEAESATYEEGKKMLERCQEMMSNMLTSMMSAGSVFDVISQSLQGDFSSLDRAPERAVMVGFLSLMSDVGKPEHCALVALLSDVGLLKLPPAVLSHFRRNQNWDFEEDLKASWEEHPQLSFNCVAQKKMQLDPVVRDAILNSHARLDEKGFPHTKPDRISVEAQLVHLVQLLDDQCQIQWGKPRLDYQQELHRLLKDPASMAIVAPSVVNALRKSI